MGKFLMGEENWLRINNEIPATGENDNEFAEHGPPETQLELKHRERMLDSGLGFGMRDAGYGFKSPAVSTAPK
ncbi:GM10788 [Drosophila sechellia]|uniref:GM10788 n=1 Tax=Drosophila sechellia TaxID=7238 RepID=B4I3W1_DROSE|nr:GM10788 [Drosophila sechellia]